MRNVRVFVTCNKSFILEFDEETTEREMSDTIWDYVQEDIIFDVDVDWEVIKEE